MSSGRQALVIGNGKYSKNLKLDCPHNDAIEMADSLKKLGFTVTLGVDQNYDSVRKLVDEFILLVNEPITTTSLLYYSGHGLQIKGENFLIPIDYDEEQPNKLAKLISVQEIVDQMTSATAVKIIFLDACRSNFEARSYIGGKGVQAGKTFYFNDEKISKTGLAEIKTSSNSFVAFAAAPGDIAFEGKPGERLSPFTASLVRNIDAVDLPISNLTSRIRLDVMSHTDGKQKTWDQSSLLLPFYFNPGSIFMIMGNAYSLLGLIFSFLIYTFSLLSGEIKFKLLFIASIFPICSLFILIFGVQKAYSRLLGKEYELSNNEHSLLETFKNAAIKGVMGGYTGSLITSTVIAIMFHKFWVDSYNKWLSISSNDTNGLGLWVEPPKPLGQSAVEIGIGAALTASICGSLILFFSRVEFKKGGLCISKYPTDNRILSGGMLGGILAGIICSPVLTWYFGNSGGPILTPDLLLPGVIIGVVFFVFSVVNFNFERLNSRQLKVGLVASILSLLFGGIFSLTLFGLLYVMGVVDHVVAWMVAGNYNPASYDFSYTGLDFRLLLGGVIYGIPVGALIGFTVAVAIILTDRLSSKPIFRELSK